MAHLDTALFLPANIFINRLTSNPNYGRLFFHLLLASLSGYEIINKQLFYFENLDNYNYIGEKCTIIAMQYFISDLYYVYNKPQYLFHHFICIFGMTYAITFEKYYILALYLYLGEISSIFLDLYI